MKELNIRNSSSPDEIVKKSFWRQGKEESKKFYEMKFKKSTDFKSLFFGILLTILVVLPFIVLLVQFFKAFYYNPPIRLLLICIAWGILLLCNGLSNYFSVKLAKLYFYKNDNLMKIDEKAIFFYQTFNIGFMVFTLIIIIFVSIGTM